MSGVGKGGPIMASEPRWQSFCFKTKRSGSKTAPTLFRQLSPGARLRRALLAFWVLDDNSPPSSAIARQIARSLGREVAGWPGNTFRSGARAFPSCGELEVKTSVGELQTRI